MITKKVNVLLFVSSLSVCGSLFADTSLEPYTPEFRTTMAQYRAEEAARIAAANKAHQNLNRMRGLISSSEPTAKFLKEAVACVKRQTNDHITALVKDGGTPEGYNQLATGCNLAEAKAHLLNDLQATAALKAAYVAAMEKLQELDAETAAQLQAQHDTAKDPVEVIIATASNGKDGFGEKDKDRAAVFTRFVNE